MMLKGALGLLFLGSEVHVLYLWATRCRGEVSALRHVLRLEGAPAAWHSMASELQQHLRLRFAFPHPCEVGCLWVVGRVIKPVDPVVVVPALHPLSCEVGLLLDAVCVGFCARVKPSLGGPS